MMVTMSHTTIVESENAKAAGMNWILARKPAMRGIFMPNDASTHVSKAAAMIATAMRDQRNTLGLSRFIFSL